MNNSVFQKRLGFILLAALALRGAVAIADHVHPLLPAYNYTDARDYDESAKRLLDESMDRASRFAMPKGKELYSLWTALLYRIVGDSPLTPRLFNALFASLSIFIWALIAARLFSPVTALATAVTLCLWPSHAFYSAQHLKEGFTMLLIPLSFLFGLKNLESPELTLKRRDLYELGAGAVFLSALGFFRAAFLPPIGVSFFLGALAARRAGFARPCAVVLSMAAAILLYRGGYSSAQNALHAEIRDWGPVFIELEANPSAKTPPRFTPLWVSHLRNHRHASSQLWAKNYTDRRIQTQILPGVRLDSWLSLAAFTPKVVFHALFMPLPGLYPMAGKLSRVAAASENLVLIAFFILAVAGFLGGSRSPAKIVLFSFFFVIAVPAALFEFDLGSAARHKLHYFPFLFPFALQFILGKLRPRWLEKAA